MVSLGWENVQKMLQRQPVYFRGNGRYGSGQFKGGRMVKLQKWSVSKRENGHVTEVASLVEGEWSCYRGGHFNGGRMVTLQKWSL